MKQKNVWNYIHKPQFWDEKYMWKVIFSLLPPDILPNEIVNLLWVTLSLHQRYWVERAMLSEVVHISILENLYELV